MAIDESTHPFSVRVGTDIVEIDAVRRSIEHFGDRYLQRIYTSDELTTCVDAGGRPAPQRLAGRFAAKESAVKALRPNFGFSYTDVAVVSGFDGCPTVRLSGAMAAHATALGVRTRSLSISHDGGYAIATFVALLPSQPEDPDDHTN